MSVEICPYCEEAPDGDRVSWLTGRKKCCNKPGCVRRHELAYDSALRKEGQRVWRYIVARRQFRAAKHRKGRKAA